MKRCHGLAVLITLLASTALLCAADQSYTQRGAPQREGNSWVEKIQCAMPVTKGNRLVIRADRGSVIVQPWPADRLDCTLRLTAYARNPETARNCLNHYLFRAVRIPGGVLLNGQSFCPARSGALGARFQIQIPLKFNLDIQTQGGSVEVPKLDGQLRAETTGGDISTGDVQGPVWVSTDAGMIDLGNINQNVQATTAGGNIRVGNVNGRVVLNSGGGEIVAGIVNGPVTAQTGAGDIVLQAASGPVEAETAGGQIRLGECGNTVHAETAAGNIQVAGARGGIHAQSAGGSISLLQAMSFVMAQTGAGHILAQIDANRKSFGPSRLDTQVGDVDVLLPPSLPLSIHAAIENGFGHRIVSDFPVKVVQQGGGFMMGPVTGTGEVMGGGEPLNLQTVMGSILIRRLDPAVAAQMKAFQSQFWARWRRNEEAESAAMRSIQELQSRLAQQRSVIDRQVQALDSRLEEQAREQERSEGFRKIQELQQRLQTQVQQTQEQRAEQFQELQQRLERQTAELQQRLQEMESRMAEQVREQIHFVQDQEH
jgi:hypothetical protein